MQDPEITRKKQSEAGKRNVKFAHAARNKGYKLAPKIQVYLGRELYDAFVAEAKRQEKSLAELAREIVREYLAERGSPKGKGWKR